MWLQKLIQDAKHAEHIASDVAYEVKLDKHLKNDIGILILISACFLGKSGCRGCIS